MALSIDVFDAAISLLIGLDVLDRESLILNNV